MNDSHGESTNSVVGAFDAKTHLSELLDRVEREGASILITRHGKPVARLVPCENIDTKRVAKALAAIDSIAKGKSLKGTSIRDLINEGRRF
ncbi:MAG: type II toxin-antitoxin system Phd/YefM family antitoxin [Planctomycetes bacterium]|nr:type II toxin-antitoxin system Phd/YefM family antitoxin [Planctomycetota bacterium]